MIPPAAAAHIQQQRRPPPAAAAPPAPLPQARIVQHYRQNISHAIPQATARKVQQATTQKGESIISGNKSLYVGICFLALGSLILSLFNITFVTKFSGCAECTPYFQKQQEVLNVLYILLVVQILMQIALFVTAMCMVWGIIKEVRLTYGIYIGFAFMMLLLDAVILGMVNQSKELRRIRAGFKNNKTFIGFQTCMGLQVGIRAVSIIISFVTMFKEGIMSILNDPTTRGVLSMATTAAAASNPATAPAALATTGLPALLSNVDIASLGKMFIK